MNAWLNAAISCACRNSSVTRMSEASEVSLTRLMKVFDSGGTDTRAACGRMIRRSASRRDMPIMCAASHWPFGTDWIAARDHLGGVPTDVQGERDDRARPRADREAHRRKPVEDHEQLNQERGPPDHGDVRAGESRDRRNTAQPHQGHEEPERQSEHERCQRHGNRADDGSLDDRPQRVADEVPVHCRDQPETSSPKYFFEICASVPSALSSAIALSTALTKESLPLRKAIALRASSLVSAATFRLASRSVVL